MRTTPAARLRRTPGRRLSDDPKSEDDGEWRVRAISRAVLTGSARWGGDALPVSLTWTPRSSFRGDVRLTAGILVFLSGTKVAAMALNAIGRCWRAGGIQGDRNGQVDM